MTLRLKAILPVAGIVGGIYSAGFLFGYNYHKKFTDDDAIQTRTPSPPPPPPPSATVETPSDISSADETFSSNTLIDKFGLPTAGPTLYYANHVLLYDQVKKIPRWVAESLTSDNLQGEANRRRSNFKPDPNVPEMFRAGNEDFRAAGRGMSRGHMAPAGNNKKSQEAMDDSFLLTNILPQNYKNNAGFWNRLEMYCRELTSRWNEVHVISGHAMRPTTEVDPQSQQETKFVKYRVVGDKEVAVPTHLYKVILCRGNKQLDENQKSQSDLAMGAFLVGNEDISWSKDLRDFQLPIEEVERVAGLTFYPRVEKHRAQDLCIADTCNLMKYDEFQRWIIGRQLGDAKTENDVRAAWKKLESKNLKPDEYLSNLLKEKSELFGLTTSDFESNEQSSVSGG